MITKSCIKSVVDDQQNRLSENGIAYKRSLLETMPYLTDKPLIMSSVRGVGADKILIQMLLNDYPQAWYTDFGDPRLDGFDINDTLKLNELIDESGKGVLFFNSVDMIPEWDRYISSKIDQGFKIVANVSMRSVDEIKRQDADNVIIKKIYPLSFHEYLDISGSSTDRNSLSNYIQYGGVIEGAKLLNLNANQTSYPQLVRKLYQEIINNDLLLQYGIRDLDAFRRVALNLIAHSGEMVSANKMRAELKIKAVSSVSDYFNYLESSGLISFVPIYSDQPSRQAVNPRMVYIYDTAIAGALCMNISNEQLFRTMIYNHLKASESAIYYSSEEGGCDFITIDKFGQKAVIQTSMQSDYDSLSSRIEGLVAAMNLTDQKTGTVVTQSHNDLITVDDKSITIIDAVSFLTSNL